MVDIYFSIYTYVCMCSEEHQTKFSYMQWYNKCSYACAFPKQVQLLQVWKCEVLVLCSSTSTEQAVTSAPSWWLENYGIQTPCSVDTFSSMWVLPEHFSIITVVLQIISIQNSHGYLENRMYFRNKSKNSQEKRDRVFIPTNITGCLHCKMNLTSYSRGTTYISVC